MANPNDSVRDKILRYLYERHSTTRSINKIPIGIRDLNKELKERHGLSQKEVASNLDYLVQVGWVCREERERPSNHRRWNQGFLSIHYGYPKIWYGEAPDEWWKGELRGMKARSDKAAA